MAPERRPLKLRAEDADDLGIISACLQDAIVAVRDFAYVEERREFLFVANRFCWEVERAGGRERTLCGVAFREVDAVSYRGFRRGDSDRLLSLLAIRVADARPGITLLLEFSGGASIRLAVAGIATQLADLGEPWPTPWRPDHAEGGQ